ncbi:MAG: MarR family transcriptional regulator [bacterium]|nr:MarR family transcriptional regulator [bacterium]
MGNTRHLMHSCLFFTANALSRRITHLADEAFRPTGLSPSLAFLLMAVVDRPGNCLKDLGQDLQLAPSTITRFADALAARSLVVRRQEGKVVSLAATDAGQALMPAVQAAWKDLYDRYSAALGREAGDDLTRRVDQANQQLEE